LIAFLISFLLYPYPYQKEAFFISFLILSIFGLVAYGLYKLITWKMGTRTKSTFQRFLVITGITLVVLFFIALTFSLITTFQVNKQLGFSYATPDTPEGELFEIQKVVPGKTMDKAGLKPLDQVQMRDTGDLYRLLIDNQGKEVEIPIKRDNQKMLIKVMVPEMDLPLARVSFLF
jgi:hypothetical protein